MNLITYPDREMMMLDLAGHLAEDLTDALHRAERITFCVPGGTTPSPIFEALTEVDLDWARVDLLLSDERWVPETSPRSNTRMIKRRLMKGRAAKAHLVPLYRDAPEPEDVLDDLIQGILPVLPIDVLLLGMGDDMHTASLFPGADRLADALAADAPALMPMRAPGAPEPRVTLTAPVLRGALVTHLVITGADKRAALQRANDLEMPQAAPVATVLNDAIVHWAE